MGSNPTLSAIFFNGKKNKGLGAERKFSTKSFLRNLRTSQKASIRQKRGNQMPHSKFQLYKHIKISGKWRYCRAAIYSNGKVKPHVVVVGAQEEKHEEGLLLHPPQKNLGSKLAPMRSKHSGCAANSLTKRNIRRYSQRLSRRARRSCKRPRDTSPISKLEG